MNGYDFAPSSPVAVTTTFGEPLTVETDETGSFTQWIVVPETAPEGPATITATDGISTVATSITLEFPATNAVRPGEAALITGEGFASRQPVRAVVDGLPGATTETATDNEGRFQLSVRFPSDTEPGRYLLTITIGTGDPMQPDTVIRYATEVLPPDG